MLANVSAPAPAPSGNNEGGGGVVVDAAVTKEKETAHKSRRAAAKEALKAAMQAAPPEGEGEETTEPTKPTPAFKPKPKTEPIEAPSEETTDPDIAPPPVDEKQARQERLAKFLANKGEKSALQTTKAEFEAFKKRSEAAIEQARQEATRSVLDQLRKAPKSLFEQHGVPASEVMQAAMDDATQDPVKILEQRYAKLEARLEAEAKQREQMAHSLQEREQQAYRQEEQRRATSAVFDAAEKFPLVCARYQKNHEALLQEIARVGIEYHRRVGERPTYEDVAEYLESQEEEIFASYSKVGAKASAPNSPQVKARIGNGLPATSTTPRASGAPTKAATAAERVKRAKAAEAMNRRK